MSRPGIKFMARPIAVIIAGIAIGASLGGCSDIYTDRRDAIGLGAGDAIAANKVAETVDPWPPHSGNTNIGFNGAKMQSAVERYRTNRVIPPVDSMTSDVAVPQQQGAAPAASATQTATGGSAPPTSSTTASQ